MADVDFWIIGDPGGAIGGISAGFARIGFQDYVRVNNLDDMVTAILRRLGPNDRIRTLHITDHGYSYHSEDDKKKGFAGHGLQAVGHTTVYSWEVSGKDAVGPQKLAQALAPLRPRFAPGAQVMLEGCTVGQADLLLAAVSSALGGVAVSGGSNYQRPTIPGIEGYIRTCVQMPGAPASCTTTREWSTLGRAGYWFDENVTTTSLDAVRTGWDKVSKFVVHLLETSGRAQMEAAKYGYVPLF
jgi:hypothetical protein